VAAPDTVHADAGSQVQPSAAPPVGEPAAPVPWQNVVVWFAIKVHAPVTVVFTTQPAPQLQPSAAPVGFWHVVWFVEELQNATAVGFCVQDPVHPHPSVAPVPLVQSA
jgi:hypothetical protein